MIALCSRLVWDDGCDRSVEPPFVGVIHEALAFYAAYKSEIDAVIAAEQILEATHV